MRIVEKIKIITDSTSDLPKNIIEQYDIEVLPLMVSFGDESFEDGVDIKLYDLLRKIDEQGIFPTTSQVNPQKFAECYQSYLSQGYKIISIHISSKMSGTYQSACIAKEMIESEDIIVIDSLNVTAGLGLLVMKACTLNEKGHQLKFIESEILKLRPKVRSALGFERLDNLVKGGRLSRTAGIIGNILGIKPILAIKDGEMAVIDKVRGSKKAVRTILDYIDTNGIKDHELCFLLYVENEDILTTLRENLNSKGIRYIEGEVGCVVGVHAGKNACGIFFIGN